MLAAIATFTACSSDDAVNDEPSIGSEANAYMNVKISLTGNSTRAASRAATDAGFEAGTNKEYTVNTARFLFFDTDGTYKTVGHTFENSDGSNLNGTENSNDNNIESTVEAKVVLGPTTITGPLKMLTFLNCDETKFNSLIGKSLSEVLATTTDVTPSVAGSFEMTNSAYVGNLTADDGTKGVVQYTYVPTGKFYSTATEATTSNNYVTAYVERTVAKVQMTVKGTPVSAIKEATNETPCMEISTKGDTTYIYPIKITGDNNSVSTFNVNDADGHLAVKVLGWSVNGYNASGNLIKDINNNQYKYITDPLDDWEWNDENNYRSYWAEDANYTTETRKDLKYKKIEDVRGSFASQYVHENTVDQAQALYTPGEQTPNVTTMLIVGQVGTWDATGGTGFTSHSYIYRINGAYYTTAGIKNLLASKYYTDRQGYTALDTAAVYIDNVPSSPASPYILITNTANTTGNTKQQIGNVTFTATVKGTLYDTDGNTVDDTAVNNYLKSALHITTSSEIECYKDGYCYYQVPIEHPVVKNGETAKKEGTIYGVVRNHTYKLTLNSISNIGDPIYKTDKKLEPIPGKDKYYYVGAGINVLEWREVNQDVEL